ncbi:RidA family protein [Citreimonas salinaria]|uniref:Enamine deaminase RidA, house cleaning of reactive enamine intermediates, YjgF/YER057c/UK114 family n=1 Tax=Citreimonas salinaria TaxID=321339 RepID=A0A1H3KVF9_9RHOB|nr:RidA family protein [Citreimonas salinaria]SDY56187.1 Enamine deaminase RidA, house cleaning of reactive enamine intermediates, YjgF/YER057c/UK114 family [Citreimonas salinaria]
MRMLIAVTTAALMAAGAVQAQDIVRNRLPGSDFPIAQSVEIPPGASVLYVSGQVPPVVDEEAEPGSREAYGDTETQTVGVLERVDAALQAAGYTMDDVVKMQVFLVGDPEKGGAMDFEGFMKGYTQFFGVERGNLPARSAMQVAGLASPVWLVEIEVMAAKMPE